MSKKKHKLTYSGRVEITGLLGVKWHIWQDKRTGKMYIRMVDVMNLEMLGAGTQ